MTQKICSRTFRKITFFTMTCLLFACFPCFVVAAEVQANKNANDWKTVGVISFASADEGIATVKRLTAAAGHEGLIDDFEKKARENFKTVDFTKPKGLVVQTNGKSFNIFLFLPIDDVTALPFEIGEKIANAEKDENGWYKIPLPTRNFLYVNQQKNWAYATFGPRLPKNLSEDPISLLEGLDKEYLVAAKFNSQNMPKSLLGGYALMAKQTIPMIRMFVPIHDEPAEMREFMKRYFDLVEKLCAGTIDILVKTVKETENITFGLKVSDANDVVFESKVNILPETETAEVVAETGKATTSLIGFYQPEETIFSVVGVEVFSDTYKKFYKPIPEGYAGMFSPMLNKIRDDKNKPESVSVLLEHVDAITKVAVDVANKTIDTGKIEIAETVFPSGAILVATKVADGKQFVPVLDQLFTSIQERLAADFGKEFVVFEKSEYAETHLWSFCAPLAKLSENGNGNADMPKSLAAESFSFVVAVNDQLLAFSYGLGKAEEHVARMKRGIDATKTPVAAPEKVLVFTPQQLGVFLKKLEIPELDVQKAVQILYDAPKDATMTLTNHIGTNAIQQQLVISGKLWPTIGEFGEMIAKQIEKEKPRRGVRSANSL